jgi:folate-binding protein YgfZ
MTSFTLQEKLTAAGAQLGEYGGARTAATFGDPRAELHALRGACGVYDLTWRGKLVITGEDRVRWLNGMITGNVRDLPMNHGTYSFLLNPQGRIQADLYAFNRGDYLLVTSDAAQIPRLTETFDHYIIMDDVEVADVSSKLASIGLGGPQATDVLSRAGFVFPSALKPLDIADLEWRGLGVSVARGDSKVHPNYEIWFHPDHAASVWDALVAAGALPVGSQALEWDRILSGVPRYGLDIGDRDLPQETGQERALHYSKGCYVGQEIVERIHSRGNVHRQFAGFIVNGAPPERGTKVRVGDKDVGEITSAATIPTEIIERTYALGYLRREHAAVGTEVQIGDATANVASLPFQD